MVVREARFFRSKEMTVFGRLMRMSVLGAALLPAILSANLKQHGQANPQAGNDDNKKGLPSAASKTVWMLTADEIAIIRKELSRQDSGFRNLGEFPAVISVGNFRLIIKPQNIRHYEGQQCCYGISSVALHDPEQPQARPFYGVERIIHYLAFDALGPRRGVSVQERVTTLYENTSRFEPSELHVFESTPFQINAEGTFADIQTLGQYEEPLPDSMIQVLKQELIIAGHVATTLYIVKTPFEIQLIGYLEHKENSSK
jgi:hypothetical protein